MIHDTDATTLLSWYITELPKYIAKYSDDKDHQTQVIEASAVLKAMRQLVGLDDLDEYIKRSLKQI